MSDEDMWNGFLTGEEQEEMALAQLARGREEGANSFVSMYFENSIGFYPHTNWTETTANLGIMEWLFSNVNDAE